MGPREAPRANHPHALRVPCTLALVVPVTPGVRRAVPGLRGDDAGRLRHGRLPQQRRAERLQDVRRATLHVEVHEQAPPRAGQIEEVM